MSVEMERERERDVQREKKDGAKRARERLGMCLFANSQQLQNAYFVDPIIIFV